MQRIGVIGVGHFGKYHVNALKEIPGFDLVGFYDIDKETSKIVSKEFGVPSFPSYESLLSEIDVVDIVIPTVSHYECAVEALKKQKHVFIEKPVTNSVEDAENLLKLAEEASVKVQIGHIERFNPAFLSAVPHILNPMFIEIHRLQPFTNRSTDVSVILNLMIHDIDIVLSIVNSNIKRISASGIKVVTNTPDLANARLEFDNGCVANLTASRISMKNMRKSRFFQKDAYISVDFLEKKCEVVKMKDAPEVPGDFDMILQNAEGVKKQIYFSNPNVEQNNAILDELESFADAINNDTTPVVTLDQATDALKVAYQIIDCFKK